VTQPTDTGTHRRTTTPTPTTALARRAKSPAAADDGKTGSTTQPVKDRSLTRTEQSTAPARSANDNQKEAGTTERERITQTPNERDNPQTHGLPPPLIFGESRVAVDRYLQSLSTIKPPLAQPLTAETE
jgi:hypothetical protein